MIKRLIACAIATAALACAQWSDFSAVTGSPNLYRAMNGKATTRTGSGSPSSLACTQGLDFYLDTASPHVFYECGVSGSPGTWLPIGLAGASVAPSALPATCFGGTTWQMTGSFLAGLQAVTVSSGGNGYVTGDVVTVVNSGASGGTATVTASGGVVTSLAVLTIGTGYKATGLTPRSTTGGTGTGLTVLTTVTPMPGVYVCGPGNQWYAVFGSNGEFFNAPFGVGKASPVFVSPPNSGAGLTLEPYPGSPDQGVGFAMLSQNDHMPAIPGATGLQLGLNGSPGGPLYVELEGTGTTPGFSTIQFGEFNQDGPDVMTLKQHQFCFGNPSVEGQYCTFVMDLNGNLRGEYSFIGVPSTPNTTVCANQGSTPDMNCGNWVMYTDPTSKLTKVKNDAGTIQAMVKQGTPASSGATCTPPEVWYDSAFAYYCTAANTFRRVATSSF